MKKNFLYLLAFGLLTACSDSSRSEVAPGGELSGGASSGVGGSFARFTVVGDHLYTVDNNALRHYDISNASQPRFINNINLGWGIETVFPYRDKLFIGANDGMHIMDISNPSVPDQLSHYRHVEACDPVVADDNYAYVTLHANRRCGGAQVNELQVIDISNLRSPQLYKTYQMTKPMGLGYDGDDLFICDDGLKRMDKSNVNDITLKQHLKINAWDVIPYRGIVMVIGQDGLYQYSYQGTEMQMMSKIPVYRKL